MAAMKSVSLWLCAAASTLGMVLLTIDATWASSLGAMLVGTTVGVAWSLGR